MRVCRRLLLVGNLFGRWSDMCMDWSWFVAVDAQVLRAMSCLWRAWRLTGCGQLHLVCPLLVFACWRWPRAGGAALVLLLGGSVVAHGLLAAHYSVGVNPV